jgi:hypothetical protein
MALLRFLCLSQIVSRPFPSDFPQPSCPDPSWAQPRADLKGHPTFSFPARGLITAFSLNRFNKPNNLSNAVMAA